MNGTVEMVAALKRPHPRSGLKYFYASCKKVFVKGSRIARASFLQKLPDRIQNRTVVRLLGLFLYHLNIADDSVPINDKHASRQQT